VFYGNKVYSDSTLLAIFETELQFGISMTHGVHPTTIKTTVTSVEGYEVLTLDGLPAVDTFSKLLGVPKEDILEKYTDLSTGIILGMPDPMGQYSIHTASYFTARGGIRLTSKVRSGTTLTIMEPNSVSMLAAGTESIRKAIIRGGITDIAMGFTYYCALRPKIIGQRYEEELSRMIEMLGGKPMVGFFSFGEQGVGDDGDSRYNNTAVACLVLGNELSEMAQVALENKRLLKEIREYDQLKSEFIANISHEFRTPINVILGSLQLFELQNSPVQHLQKGEKADRYIKVMKQNCYRLVRLTNNLIDITKLETGFSEIDLHNHNIVQVIEDITQSVAEYVKIKDLELLFDTDTEEKIMAVDADKLERIMLNLLSNAVKFSNTGGRISVNFQSYTDTVKISVKDTGIGIPLDKCSIIFERFRQVDSSLSRNHEGSGIGLSLVKSLVELHGGKISVNSDFGKGSEFIIELPVKIVDEQMNTTAKYDTNQDHVHRIMMEFSDIYAI
jgi:signal transduction histidine kinase